MALALPFVALLAASCGGKEGSDEPVGDPPADVLANRIENLAIAAPEEEEAEKAEPRRLGVLREAELPAELRTGRACRLTAGANLYLVAGASGAVASIDGRIRLLPTAGPVGPSGGFWEAPGVSVSIALKPPEGAAIGSPTTRAGVTVGGDDAKPIQRGEGSWTCA